MITFIEWRKKIEEMAGTGAIITKCPKPSDDWQVMGSICDKSAKPKTAKMKKK